MVIAIVIAGYKGDIKSTKGVAKTFMVRPTDEIGIYYS